MDSVGGKAKAFIASSFDLSKTNGEKENGQVQKGACRTEVKERVLTNLRTRRRGNNPSHTG